MLNNRENNSQKEAFIIAESAVVYAKDHIKYCSTSIDNNNLSEKDFDVLVDKVEVQMKKMKNEYAQTLLQQKIKRHPSLIEFESAIAISKEHQAGNCSEYALLALEYILLNAPRVSAEIFEIKNGDHVFVVINREANGNPGDPSEWGETAIVCDPWANTIYPASELDNKLKNFTRDDKKNILQNYNDECHRLAFIPWQNTCSIKNLQLIYSKKERYAESVHQYIE